MKKTFYGVITGGDFCHSISLPLGVDSFQMKISNMDELRYFEKMTKKFVQRINSKNIPAKYLIEGVIKLKAIKMNEKDILLNEGNIRIAESYNKDDSIHMMSHILDKEGPYPYIESLFPEVETGLEAMGLLNRHLFPNDFLNNFGRREFIKTKKETQKEIVQEKPVLEKFIYNEKLHIEENEKLGGKIMNDLKRVFEMLKEVERKIDLSANVEKDPNYGSIVGMKETIIQNINTDINDTIQKLYELNQSIITENMFKVENINDLSVHERMDLPKDTFGIIQAKNGNRGLLTLSGIVDEQGNGVGRYNHYTQKAYIKYNNFNYVIDISEDMLDAVILEEMKEKDTQTVTQSNHTFVASGAVPGFAHFGQQPPAFLKPNPLNGFNRSNETNISLENLNAITRDLSGPDTNTKYNVCGKILSPAKEESRIIHTAVTCKELYDEYCQKTGFAILDNGVVIKISYGNSQHLV